MKTNILFCILILSILSCNFRQKSREESTEISTDTIGTVNHIKPIDPMVYLQPVGDLLQYRKRTTLQRLIGSTINYHDSYKIETLQPVYTPGTDTIHFNVINVDAPTAELEYYHMEQWDGQRWITFPFRDNIAFTGPGIDLNKGDTIKKTIYMSSFKEPLKTYRYRIHFYVFLNIAMPFTLTEDSILVYQKDINRNTPWNFQVLNSSSDSIRVIFENNSNLLIQPYFFPSVFYSSERYEAHPLARSGASTEHEWMQKHGKVAGGEALLISIPRSWDINRLNIHQRENYKSGKLNAGDYDAGFQIAVYMNTEFEVK